MYNMRTHRNKTSTNTVSFCKKFENSHEFGTSLSTLELWITHNDLLYNDDKAPKKKKNRVNLSFCFWFWLSLQLWHKYTMGDGKRSLLSWQPYSDRDYGRRARWDLIHQRLRFGWRLWRQENRKSSARHSLAPGNAGTLMFDRTATRLIYPPVAPRNARTSKPGNDSHEI